MRGIKKTFIYFFCLLTLVAWYQTWDRWDSYGSGLAGVEVPVETPVPGIPAFINGSYQRGFDKYMTRKMGIRKRLVMLDNQVNFSLFGEFRNGAVTMGRDGYLFRDGFIRSYNRADFIETDELRANAMEARRLQDMLKARGKGFVYYLAASKAETYPEYLPEELIDHEARAQRESNYERYKVFLEEYGVNHIDGQGMMEEIKNTSPYPPFTKSGIHWSSYASLLFTQRLIGMMEDVLDKRLVRLKSAGVEPFERPQVPEDADLADLSNILFKSIFYDDAYYYHKIEADDGGGEAQTPSVLWDGDSFSWSVLGYLGRHGVIPECVANFYFNRRFEIVDGMPAASSPIDRATFDLTVDLEKAEIIVVGYSISHVTRGSDFISHALKTLEQ